LSESQPAGRLINIPGTVEAEATTPSRDSGVLRDLAKGFKTGFLAIVELRMANTPTKHKAQNNLSNKASLKAKSFPAKL
jgi:hypothetical protein